MEIHTLPLGMLEANCYILHQPGSSQCVVLDPGGDARRLGAFLQRQGLTAVAVLLTHRHFDHVGAADAVAEQYGCPIYLHPLDAAAPDSFLFGKVGKTTAYEEGDCLTLAGLRFAVLHTPGHSEGSVCLRVEDALFTGDTLFQGSCGRVDFPGSSPKAMRASLARLAALEGDCAVYPGHGGSTSLSAERQSNPYMTEI